MKCRIYSDAELVSACRPAAHKLDEGLEAGLHAREGVLQSQHTRAVENRRVRECASPGMRPEKVRGRECSDLHEIDLEDGGGFEIHVGEVEVRHLRGVPQHKAAARAAHDGHFVHPVELSENFARMHKTM